MTRHAYIDATHDKRVNQFHPVIMAAIKNNGVFDDDFSDVFKLVKLPSHAAAEYRLEWA